MEEILKVEGLRKTFKQTKKLFSKQTGGGIKVAVDDAPTERSSAVGKVLLDFTLIKTGRKFVF